jgi:K+-sensing histidine kinase KdpD
MRTLFATLRRSLTHRYLVAVFVVASITGIIQLFDPVLEIATIAMVFLLGVLIVATTAGLGPGILTSLLSFLAFDFSSSRRDIPYMSKVRKMCCIW